MRTSGIVFRLALCALLLHLFVSGASAGDEVRVYSSAEAAALAAKVVEAHGGEEAVRAARSIYATGTITATMSGDSGTYTRYMERDGKLRVEIGYSKEPELRILNGKKGWRGTDRRHLEMATLYRLVAMVYQYRQIDLPYILLAGDNEVRVEGVAIVGGKRADILSVKSKGSPEMDVYVDSKTHLVLKVTGYFDIDGRKSTLAAEFSDYRKTGGVMLPYKVTNFANGALIGETVITGCEVNRPMKPSLFTP